MKRTKSIVLLIVLLLLTLPVQAASQQPYVTDGAGLLTDGELAELENLCADVSAAYDCGVYVVTVEDFRVLGTDDVFEATYELYHGLELGMGAERNGLILLLSMAERDYALFVYGDDAEYAFGIDAQIMLEEQFLPLLGDNDWYGGFRVYAETCRSYLAQAAAGNPVRGSVAGPIAVCVLVSFLIALIVVLILRAGMKNVKKQSEASQYLSGQLKLTRKFDQFTHKTETRRKIETSSGGSSTARSGGGGSGRSGKF